MPDRLTRIHQRVMFTLADAPLVFWRLEWPLHRLLCAVAGHVPERDQCGRPEHDFCLWCHKSMPNSWVKPKAPDA